MKFYGGDIFYAHLRYSAGGFDAQFAIILGDGERQMEVRRNVEASWSTVPEATVCPLLLQAEIEGKFGIRFSL